MHTKHIIYPGIAENGTPNSRVLFGSHGEFEKVGGAPPFAEWETGDQIRRYVEKLSRKDRQLHCYTLVNALSAGEFYSSNINADWFGWDQLSHEGPDYGYRTFEIDAHLFQHHTNDDPKRALGLPVLSMLNHTMRRVEVIAEFLREKAYLEGAGSLIARIDRGEFVPFSMGCKVKYDICSICEHKCYHEFEPDKDGKLKDGKDGREFKRLDKEKGGYCEHLRPPPELQHIYGPNKILPDGRKIFVRNPKPRFFDLSAVYIGAEKTAFGMAKIAGMAIDPQHGFIGTPYEAKKKKFWPGQKLTAEEKRDANSDASYTKEAAAKVEEEKKVDANLETIFRSEKTAQQKLSELIKRVPAESFSTHVLPSMEEEDTRNPLHGLLNLLQALPISHSLGHLAERGIVLRPPEFQRLILMKMGKEDFADELNERGQVFKPSDEFEDIGIDVNCCGEIEECLKNAKEQLDDAVRNRSAFGRPFTLRLSFHSRAEVPAGKKPLPTSSSVTHPLLDKLGSAYNGYRRDVLMKLSQAEEVVQRDPRLREMFTGNGLSEIFMKTASNTPIVSLDSMKYLLGAHFANRGLFSDPIVAETIASKNERLFQEP